MMEDDPSWHRNCQSLARSLQSLQKRIGIIKRYTKKIVNVADINRGREKIRETTRLANTDDVTAIHEALRLIQQFMELRPSYSMEGVKLMGDAHQTLKEYQVSCDNFYKTCISVEESQRGSTFRLRLTEEMEEDELEDEANETELLLSARAGPTQRALYEQELHNEIVAELERETNEIAENLRDVNIIANHIAKLAEEQGVHINQIDRNLDDAARSTRNGVEQLRRANEHQNSSSRYKYALFAVLFFMVLIVLHLLAK